MLGGKVTTVGHRLLVQADKVTDAEAVDVSVVGDALLGEVLAQISPVCADGACQLRQRKVVPQIELFILTMFALKTTKKLKKAGVLLKKLFKAISTNLLF